MPPAPSRSRSDGHGHGQWSRSTTMLGLAGITVLSLVAHARALTRPFVLDDWGYLRIAQSWHEVWAHVTEATKPIYRPTLFLWFSGAERLIGLHPLLFHVAALILLLTGAGLVYVLARRLDLPRGAALAGSAVLALHPGLDPAIAWSSAVNALLVIDFSLAAVLVLLPPTPSWRLLTLGGLFTALALGSREDAAVLPLIVVLVRAATPELAGLAPRR